MKTFLKVVLLVIVAVIAVKLLPLTFAVGCAFAAMVLGLIAAGFSAVFALAGGLLALTVILAPIWIPVLALIGLITLIKRANNRSVGVVA